MRRELFALISLGLLASSVVAQIARAFDSGVSRCTRSRVFRCRRRGKTAGIPTNARTTGMERLTTMSACELPASNLVGTM
jgi:hypothetical protein